MGTNKPFVGISVDVEVDERWARGFPNYEEVARELAEDLAKEIKAIVGKRSVGVFVTPHFVEATP